MLVLWAFMMMAPPPPEGPLDDWLEAIVSGLEESLEFGAWCCSSVSIILTSPAIECSSETICRDSWSIRAFTSSSGLPGPL